MTGIAAVALADLRQRTRTFGVLLVVAAALELGYLFVPDASARYVVVDLGGWRGLYTSTWMGATTALLTVTLLPLAGFFLVRPALHRDAQLGTADVVACAPLGRRAFVLGKWASNAAFLAAISLLLMLAAAVMQVVRGESRTIEPAAYLLPYAIITLPTCALIAAAAIVLDSARPLRGIAGGVVWFFGWNALVAVPFIMTGTSGGVAAFDPFGATAVFSALQHGLYASVAVTNIDRSAMMVGFDAAGHLRTFRFTGVPWSAGLIGTRLAWALLAPGLCALVAPIALPRDAPRATTRSSRAGFAGVVRRLPLPLLGRLELAIAIDLAGTWWVIGMGLLTLGALTVPAETLRRVVEPLIWIWPVGVIAGLSVVDRGGVDEIRRATPTSAIVRVLWRWAAAAVLIGTPIVGLAFRSGSSGPTFIAIALAVAACGVALGALTRSPLTFEALAITGWYLGPVNGVPAFDPAAFTQAPITSLGIAGIVTLCALAATAMHASKRG
jgi:ABC-type transport system involved in multi-copper enzyme maturation permease subunit